MIVIQLCLAGLAIFLSSLFIYCFYFNRNHYWAKKSLPFFSPLDGYKMLLRLFRGTTVHDMDQEMYKKRGRIFGAYQFNTPVMYVAEPELIRSILVKDFHKFSTRREFIFGIPIFDNMIVGLKGGDRWRNIRNTMTPAFSTGKLKNMIPIMSDCANLSVNNFEKYSKQTDAVDVKKLFGNFTLDIIANVAFGTQLDSHNDPDNVFVTHAKKFFSPKVSIKMILFFVFPKMANYFGIEAFSSTTMEFFENVIHSIVERRKLNDEGKRDFLQIMIESMEGGEELKCESVKDDDNDSKVQWVDQIKRKPLTKMEMISQSVLFFLAGYETTATTLTVTAYHLATNPEVQKKVLQEVDKIWSKSETLDAESLHEAKYLGAVIDETLRLAPPATRVNRTAGSEYEMGDTGITIPPGMIIEILTYCIHHDERFFPEPEKFKPERFLNNEVEPYTYLPFGAGPRNCIAMRLALMEVKLCLLHVLRRFEFSVCDKTQVPMKIFNSMATLQVKESFLKVTERLI